MNTQEENKTISCTKEELKKQISRLRARDEEPVKGIFRNLENKREGLSTGVVRFTYSYWPGQKSEKYCLVDGQQYELPRGVVNHLNNNCYTIKYKDVDPKYGNSVSEAVSTGRDQGRGMREEYKIPRFRFERLGFDDEIPVSISIVEKKPIKV